MGEADLYWTKTAFQNKLHSSSGKMLFQCTGFLKLQNVIKKNVAVKNASSEFPIFP